MSKPKRNPLSDAVIRVSPGHDPIAQTVARVWEYRELLALMVWRDIKIRYRSTFFGIAWVLFQPLAMMAAVLHCQNLWVAGERVAADRVLVFIGLAIWLVFANSITRCARCLIGDALLEKVYFPRLLLPLAAILSTGLDFLVCFSLSLITLLVLRYPLHCDPALLIASLSLVFVTSLGGGLWIACLNLRFRDLGFAIPFLLQFGLIATPFAFSHRPVSDLMGINPIVGAIAGMRTAILGTPAQMSVFFVSSLAAAILVATSLRLFTRWEPRFSEMA